MRIDQKIGKCFNIVAAKFYNKTAARKLLFGRIIRTKDNFWLLLLLLKLFSCKIISISSPLLDVYAFTIDADSYVVAHR